MNLKSSDKHYIVYKHTAPNGKVYIGITGFDPEYRWLNNGRGYKTQTTFFNAIIKYGWINFTHEVLFSGLTEKEALDKEEELIKQYQSYDRRYGYNVSLRGAVYGKETNKKTTINHSAIIAPKWTPKGKEVVRKDKEGNIVAKYKSVNAAARAIGMFAETLRTALIKKKVVVYEDTYLEYGSESKKPTIQMLTMAGEYIRSFNTQAEAHTFIGKTNKGKIARVCEGKMNSYYGYKWRYNYEDTNNKSA